MEKEMRRRRGKRAVLWLIGVWALAMAALPAFGQEQIRNGSFSEGWNLAWEAEPAGSSPLVVEDPASGEGNEGYARLGLTPLREDSLEQFLGAGVSLLSQARLSLFVRSRGKGALPGRGLRISLIEASSGLEVPLATLKGAEATWQKVTVDFSPEEKGMRAGEDYWLRLAAEGAPGASPAWLEVDDVSLAPPASAMLLPVEPPDTLPDEEGDVPLQDSPGLSFVTMAPNRDFPNVCNCGGGHREVKITVKGFTKAEWDTVTVKFKIPTSAKLATIANPVRESYDGASMVGVLRCTVPDAPGDKNYLGPASIKIKSSNGKKVWSPRYECSWNSNVGDWVEAGFFYGFPDPIRNIQVASTLQPSILGGDAFTVQADGLGLFRKWRKNLSACGTRPSEDYVRPFVFAVKSDGIPAVDVQPTPEYRKRVRVRRSDLWQATCGEPFSSTWTGDGAPGFCLEATPCITIHENGVPQASGLVLLNPDNIQFEESPDWRQYTWRHRKYAGVLLNALQFLPAPSPPSFAPGSEYGPANSVGYALDAQSNSVDIAIRPLNGASNRLTFHGTSLYRMKNIRYYDSSENWRTNGWVSPTWECSDPTAWGNRFKAWAPAHAPSHLVLPYLSCKEDPQPDYPSRAGVPFDVVPSFAAGPGSSSCLSQGFSCPLSFPANGDEHLIEAFWVGPGEYNNVNVNVGTCQAQQGSCSDFALTGRKESAGTDGEGRTLVKVFLTGNFSGQGQYNASATFPVTVTLAGYGTVETRNVNLYH